MQEMRVLFLAQLSWVIRTGESLFTKTKQFDCFPNLNRSWFKEK